MMIGLRHGNITIHQLCIPLCDMEQKGEMLIQEIALFQINRLFQAIENSDYDTIKNPYRY